MKIFLLFLLLTTNAYAVEAILPVSVRILDCKTYEKAKAVCEAEDKCCEIAEKKKP